MNGSYKIREQSICAHSSVVERLLDTQEAVGSIPTARTNEYLRTNIE